MHVGQSLKSFNRWSIAPSIAISLSRRSYSMIISRRWDLGIRMVLPCIMSHVFVLRLARNHTCRSILEVLQRIFLAPSIAISLSSWSEYHISSLQSRKWLILIDRTLEVEWIYFVVWSQSIKTFMIGREFFPVLKQILDFSSSPHTVWATDCDYFRCKLILPPE